MSYQRSLFHLKIWTNIHYGMVLVFQLFQPFQPFQPFQLFQQSQIAMEFNAVKKKLIVC